MNSSSKVKAQEILIENSFGAIDESFMIGNYI